MARRRGVNVIAGKRADPRRRAQKDAKKQPQPQDGPHVGESEEGRVGETRGGVWDGERARGRRDWAVIRKNARPATTIYLATGSPIFHSLDDGREAAGVCMRCSAPAREPIELCPSYNHHWHRRRALTPMGQLLKYLSASLSKPPHPSRLRSTTHVPEHCRGCGVPAGLSLRHRPS